LLYITQPDAYQEKVAGMHDKLSTVLPKICACFNRPDFMKVLTELEKYNKNVKKHYADFIETQRIWAKMMEHLAKIK
jgi:hypothetical protein